MRVLVLSNTPWDVNNSFGNSFSNIFSGIQDIEFANICCRPGKLNNEFEMTGFQITESSLLANLRNPLVSSGKRIDNVYGEENKPQTVKGYEMARKMRWQVMFWARDLIWKIGRWKSKDLLDFIDDFQPDIIFQPVYYSSFICEIALFLKKYTKVPMIGYISDDNYTLRRFELSPLYWIDRMHKRKKVKAVIEKCELLYVISQIQKEEYEKIFSTPCKILTKCADFSETSNKQTEIENTSHKKEAANAPTRLIYAGNLGLERWKSLALIANAVKSGNKNGQVCELEVFSPTPLTKKMKKALCVEGCTVNGPIPYEKLKDRINGSDIVIHVEGLSLKSRMAVHQSFSTKIVDYLAMGKCILAVGKEDEASIKYLSDHEAAVVCHDETEVAESLKQLVNCPDKIHKYERLAYECGKKNHDKKVIQNMLISDLKKVLER